MEKGLVREPSDLYNLQPKDLLSLEGFSEKSAKKLYRAIQNTKKPGLAHFLYALGIRHVGEHVAEVLSRHFGSLERLADAGLDELEAVEEIGPEIAESVKNFFQDEENRRILEELKRASVRPRAAKRKKSGALKGVTFVFTGELSRYTRAEAEKEVESLGGRATSSVSGNTDYLVLGKDPGSKLEEAKTHKVEILDEKEFETLLKEKRK
jgi:DNA ligase (NAD+)